MPIPKPNAGESKDDYLSRCIPQIAGEYTEDGQAAAVCIATWDAARKPKKSPHQLLSKAIRSRGWRAGGIVPASWYCQNAEARAVRRASRLLSLGGEFEGLKRSDGSNLEYPPHTLLVFEPVVTTSTKDRDGDVLMPAGAKITKTNPLLWQHDPTLPLGRMVGIMERDEKRIKFLSVLLDLNELTEDAAKLIEAGCLSISHGFRALDWEPLKNEKGEEIGGYRVNEYEMLEHSLVSVPANPEAIIELHSRGKLHSAEAKALAEAEDAKRAVSVNVPVELAGVGFAGSSKDDKIGYEAKSYSDHYYIAGSWEWLEHHIRLHLCAKFHNGTCGSPHCYQCQVLGTFSDRVIVETGGKYMSVAWSLDGDMPKLGDATEVSVRLVEQQSSKDEPEPVEEEIYAAADVSAKQSLYHNLLCLQNLREIDEAVTILAARRNQLVAAEVAAALV